MRKLFDEGEFMLVRGGWVKVFYKFYNMIGFEFELLGGRMVKICLVVLGYFFVVGMSDGLGVFDFM